MAVQHDFVLDEDAGPIVSELCVHLDGLPLAIELAAARVKHFSIQTLLARFNNGAAENGHGSGKLQFLKSDTRDIPERHRSLWAAIEWSYALLAEEEQALFRRLSIFVGGWSADAAKAICTQGLSLDIEDGLASLVDKSLVKQERRGSGETRCKNLSGDDWTLAMSLVNAGNVEALLCEFERAERLIGEALMLHRQVGQMWGMIKNPGRLGLPLRHTRPIWESAPDVVRRDATRRRKSVDGQFSVSPIRDGHSIVASKRITAGGKIFCGSATPRR